MSASLPCTMNIFSTNFSCRLNPTLPKIFTMCAHLRQASSQLLGGPPQPCKCGAFSIHIRRLPRLLESPSFMCRWIYIIRQPLLTTHQMHVNQHQSHEMAFYQRWERRLTAITPTPSNEFIKFKPRYLTSLGPPSAVKATPISLRYSSPLLLLA
jgi:hypothetical protein